MQDGEEADNSSAEINEGLDDVRPNHRSESAFERIDQGQYADDRNGDEVSAEVAETAERRTEGDTDDESDGVDAHSFGGRAGNQEEPSGIAAEFSAEAALDQLIRREEVALEILRQQDEADDDAADEIAESELQEGEVGVVCEAGDADEGEGAGLCSNDRQRERPPGDRAIGEEIILQRALRFTKAQAEESDTGKIDDDDQEVCWVEPGTRVNGRSPTSKCVDLLFTPAAISRQWLRHFLIQL